MFESPKFTRRAFIVGAIATITAKGLPLPVGLKKDSIPASRLESFYDDPLGFYKYVLADKDPAPVPEMGGAYYQINLLVYKDRKWIDEGRIGDKFAPGD